MEQLLLAPSGSWTTVKTRKERKGQKSQQAFEITEGEFPPLSGKENQLENFSSPKKMNTFETSSSLDSLPESPNKIPIGMEKLKFPSALSLLPSPVDLSAFYQSRPQIPDQLLKEILSDLFVSAVLGKKN
jgi:hypothetical protein